MFHVEHFKKLTIMSIFLNKAKESGVKVIALPLVKGECDWSTTIKSILGFDCCVAILKSSMVVEYCSGLDYDKWYIAVNNIKDSNKDMAYDKQWIISDLCSFSKTKDAYYIYDEQMHLIAYAWNEWYEKHIDENNLFEDLEGLISQGELKVYNLIETYGDGIVDYINDNVWAIEIKDGEIEYKDTYYEFLRKVGDIEYDYLADMTNNDHKSLSIEELRELYKVKYQWVKKIDGNVVEEGDTYDTFDGCYIGIQNIICRILNKNDGSAKQVYDLEYGKNYIRINNVTYEIRKTL